MRPCRTVEKFWQRFGGHFNFSDRKKVKILDGDFLIFLFCFDPARQKIRGVVLDAMWFLKYVQIGTRRFYELDEYVN